MKNFFMVAGLIVLLAGCASGRAVRVSDTEITGPRVVALNAPSAPWVIEIQSRLKQKGFRVLRWSSRSRVMEQTSGARIESYNEAEARYVLVINGAAPYNWARRCFGGGYNFEALNVDLVDTLTNETILNVNGSGYSENCPPLSGSLFGDVANAIDAAWRQ